jgi:topoisomerase-4 subunit A
MKDEEDDNIVPEGQEDEIPALRRFWRYNLEAQHFYDKKTETIPLPKPECIRTGFDYASYVILDAPFRRLKTVLNRCNVVSCTLKELDDAIIKLQCSGDTMQYHPHGDQSIGDAMVQIGQKNYWLTVNWGYPNRRWCCSFSFEARLSKFALEVIYSPKLPIGFLWWTKSEPNNLPVKFRCFWHKELKVLR